MLLSQPIERLGSIPVSRRTPVDSKKDIDDIVRWLLNVKDASDDPTVEFEKISNVDDDSFFGLEVVATSFGCFPGFLCLDDSVVYVDLLPRHFCHAIPQLDHQSPMVDGASRSGVAECEYWALHLETLMAWHLGMQIEKRVLLHFCGIDNTFVQC